MNFYLIWKLGWVLSSLFIKIVLILISVIAFYLAFKKKKRIILLLVIVTTIISFEIYFNPIYIDDYNKKGLKVNYSNNLITDNINESHTNFDGLVCFVKMDCPFCKDAIKKLSLIKKRSSVNVIIYVFSLSKKDIKKLKEITGVNNVQYELAPNENDFLTICQGKFPTFVYFRDNKFIYKWEAHQFGYPALDWVENGFKLK